MQKSIINYETPTDANNMLAAVNWYRSLTIQQKLALKELSQDICGFSWRLLGEIFTPRERIELLHQKLQMEGFVV